MSYTHDQIKTILEECAQKCILPYFGTLTSDQIDTKSSADDFVTIADREAEIYLIDVLQNLLPGSLVLGEEGYSEDISLMDRCAQADDVWIVDPIDGTTNFKNADKNFCTILSHVRHGKIIGAWIYAPLLNEFTAWAEGGDVTINGDKVTLDNAPKEISAMNACNCMVYQLPAEKAIIFNRNFSRFKWSRQCSSFGLDTVEMLRGNFDVLTFPKGNPWDISACIAMISALGGKVAKVKDQKIEGDDLFTVKGSLFAVASPSQWQKVRDTIMQDISN